MPRHLHPEDGKVYACPNCDKSPVDRRANKGGRNVTFAKGKEFVCYDCKTGFEEPVERDARSPSNGGRLPQFYLDLIKDN